MFGLFCFIRVTKDYSLLQKEKCTPKVKDKTFGVHFKNLAYLSLNLSD